MPVSPNERTSAHDTTCQTAGERSEAAGDLSARRVPTIPGYEIECELGRGAMGVVYKARQTRLNRVVALKVLLSGEHAGPKELARFRAEAETAARIQHPNVIQVFDVGEHEGVSYIATEFAGGGDLRQWLGGNRLTVPMAIKLMYTLARAVGAAHRAGIVHRDLKPANVLLADGTPKIADFGLAKVFGDAGQTTTGAILGTPSYMSPEQASGQAKRVGPPTDVYSLGVMLYECLAGRLPFAGDTLIDTLDQVRFAQPIPVQDLRADIPPVLAAIVRRCLNKVPEERYHTADELAEDLARTTRSAAPASRGGPSGATLLWLGATVVALVLGFFIAREIGLFNRSGAVPTVPKPNTPANTPQFSMP